MATATPLTEAPPRPSPAVVPRGITPGLTGVPETMLWSLHHRAAEAMRPDALLIDPESVRIHAAIDYDYDRFFGTPMGALAVRAVEMDRVARTWIACHPDGFVVSLGEGLETQLHRVDNGRVRWLSVDLPEAVGLRERFLTANDRCRHLVASALDPVWMDAVEPSRGVLVIAQGLLMYLLPEQVRKLLCGIAERFPGAEVVFDTVPFWFSRLTGMGLRQTPYFVLPPMPWGINRDEIEPTLRRWSERFDRFTFLDYGMPRGVAHMVSRFIGFLPMARNEVPSLVHVTIASARPARPLIFNTAPEGPAIRAALDRQPSGEYE